MNKVGVTVRLQDLAEHFSRCNPCCENHMEEWADETSEWEAQEVAERIGRFLETQRIACDLTIGHADCPSAVTFRWEEGTVPQEREAIEATVNTILREIREDAVIEAATNLHGC